MDASTYTRLFADLLTPILAFAMPAARIFGAIFLLPAFTRLGVTGLVRGGVALALALPIAPALMSGVASAGTLDAATLSVLLVKETLLGVIIGVFLSGPFWAVEIAGELIDEQRQSTAAIIPDAAQQSETGLTGTLLTLATVTLFFATGGGRAIIADVGMSYGIWPALTILPSLSIGGGLKILELVDQIFRQGVIVASPIVMVMLFCELSMAFLGKIAPSLNIFDMSLVLKNGIFAASMAIYVSYVLSLSQSEIAASIGGLGDWLKSVH